MANEIQNIQAQPQGEIVLYQPDETVRLEVRLENETVWLTQAQMAVLFGRDRSVVGKHINNCFREGELDAKEVCAKFAQTTLHGAIQGKVQVHDVTFYNLDVIISVGYRVKSLRGTRFRQFYRSFPDFEICHTLCSEFDSRSLLYGLDHVQQVCRKINMLNT